MQAETLLAHDPRRGPHGSYRYQVRSSRDIRDRWGSTQVIFDADTGELLHTWLPTGAASGDTIRTWLTSLHMAALWGVPLRIFMTGMGLTVAMLSVTGVVIWARKRQGRSRSRVRGRAARVPAGK
ncbi:MAG: PepSY domain-containing protein [Arenimonas sp.]|nr:PepSY domain-containing protein [Arenimonas sp.]